jgi:GntR family transcriptional regulator, rspAB operon transcriptional repressor
LPWDVAGDFPTSELLLANGDFMVVDKSSQKEAAGSSVLTLKIYQSLRDDIVSGKLKPGESLSRRRIAERYGCSYTPVIEALIRLEYAGLVESETFQTPRVCGLSLERMHGDYVLREAFETQAIRLVCEHATPDEIKELRGLAEGVDALALLKDAPTDDENAQEGPILHWCFHRRIAELSRCQKLSAELERIALLSRFKATWANVDGFPDPPRHHASLVDFIEQRDPVGADALMRAHIQRGYDKDVKGYWSARARQSDS